MSGKGERTEEEMRARCEKFYNSCLITHHQLWRAGFPVAVIGADTDMEIQDMELATLGESWDGIPGFSDPDLPLPVLPHDDFARPLVAWRVKPKRNATTGAYNLMAALAGPQHDRASSDRRSASDIFNPELVDFPADLLDAIHHSKTTVSGDDARAAWKKCWLGESQLILKASEFQAIDEDYLHKALMHVGTRLLNYTTIKSAGYAWVCRNFATLFAAIWAAVLQCNGVGVYLDFEGHHEYNFILAYSRKFNRVSVVVIEPQLDVVVEHADPPHHYVGKGGLGMLGG